MLNENMPNYLENLDNVPKKEFEGKNSSLAMNSCVSVIIPTYNRGNRITNAIDSVLNQTYRNIELIIVDDGSTDNTEDIVSMYINKDERVKYIKHEYNKGGSSARNTGIKHSYGQYVCFLDSDDKWLPSKLECQLIHLGRKGSDYAAIYCEAVNNKKALTSVLFEFSRRKLPREGGFELIKSVFLNNVRHTGSTLLIHRDAILAMGGFDETFKRHQDREFLITFLRDQKLAYLDQPLVILDKGERDLSPEVLIEVKQKFFKKFEREIDYFEMNGVPISLLQYLELSGFCFKKDNAKLGMQYFLKSFDYIWNIKKEYLNLVFLSYIITPFSLITYLKRCVTLKSRN
ncbi:glycosyltransferase family 2 protein [Methanofollis fontis]|uniref:Glycosyl transferase family 2 n=1 Tax=Methanofollis fontis TaxID=2052832 RepID=A0A483CSY9_9EURY|nr:glycosyltransferase family 2 protein [Methanofollis fontis]TAJ43693.1 glycosyl transferase family 2 [Methanofollis fontis]